MTLRMKEGMNMKKHQESFDQIVERIEQIIETLEPGKRYFPGDILAKANVKNPTNTITDATQMLMHKYGIG